MRKNASAIVGDYSLLYAWIALFNIIFTYGFETGYFRFSNKEGVDRNSLFQTAFGSLLISSIGLIVLFSFFKVPINAFINLGEHPEYIMWCFYLIGLDALCAIPFAKLRQGNRPKKYAFVKLSGIVINILFTILFLVWLPKYTANHSNDFLSEWYRGNNRVGFLLLANLLQNLFVFLILFTEWKEFRFKMSKILWRQLFRGLDDEGIDEIKVYFKEGTDKPYSFQQRVYASNLEEATAIVRKNRDDFLKHGKLENANVRVVNEE